MLTEDASPRPLLPLMNVGWKARALVLLSPVHNRAWQLAQALAEGCLAEWVVLASPEQDAE